MQRDPYCLAQVGAAARELRVLLLLQPHHKIAVVRLREPMTLTCSKGGPITAGALSGRSTRARVQGERDLGQTGDSHRVTTACPGRNGDGD
jgi:hypothetical protein